MLPVSLPEFVAEVAKDDPTYPAWYEKKERYIAEHYTETPKLETYIVTVEVEVSFARENDGVLDEHDAEMWLKGGDVLTDNDGAYEIKSVRKKE